MELLEAKKLEQEFSINKEELVGTIAIDLGNSTTVIAFQGERSSQVKLLDLPPISRVSGEIPSLVWFCPEKEPRQLIGNEVLNLPSTTKNEKNVISDFKRWICSPDRTFAKDFILSPEKAGEILINEIWKHLPKEVIVKRLVLTAPVETYREYRTWLIEVCNELKVNEIALVDEPTAAAMGANMPPGSKLLVIDIGGSTIDMSIVALEGGEGKAEPVAQLLRFGGQDLEGKSNQILRCAKVLGKAGQRLGGRDIDRWIINYLRPNTIPDETILNAAERLKCKLSEANLKETKLLFEPTLIDSKELCLSKLQLEEILKERGLIKVMENLLEQTLTSGKLNGCSLEDLENVVLVGGGARIPLIKKWLEDKCRPIKLLTPPSIEAVAIGALSLTPGVTVRDVLQKGVSIRCWDQKNNCYLWHPLFLAGQPWPTSKPLELVLATSKKNQNEIELMIGEPIFEGSHEVIYIKGIPTIKSGTNESKIDLLKEGKHTIVLKSPGQIGEDCLKLSFHIDNDCFLTVEGIDLRDNSQIMLKRLVLIR
tara:strand:- start:63480 stop:65093 length:1614 start_codon:yes stop_codon:yes gene_type:complete